ncbi:helix-turn-helix transcriptional regulator [Sphingomonas sp. LB-2]|uniref:helix-turn-helix domain-containing protein n=1 Tax=Sphingomonas caeni TaxID=2984949 RepID=UPI002231A439|nr:helix-turn-helix transcriptional regulator [Sphingomonas caeni]MCW3847911.1 helix-turn-helix transcriptional regulator [Sphingomonas caeni]
MSNAPILELLLRGAAVGGFLGLAIAIGRGGFARARVAGILFCLAAAAHTWTQLPEIRPALGVAWVPIWSLSVVGAGLFWAFAIELFEDRARFEFRRLVPIAALLALSVGTTITTGNFAKGLWLAHNLIGAILMAHVLFIVAAGWKSDLVEPRRRLRGPVLAAGATYAFAVTVVESGEILGRSAEAFSPIAATLLFAMSMAGVLAFLRADAALFGPTEEAPTEDASEPPAELAAEDARAAAMLERLMREERLSREPGLTVAALAARLRMPEYRLRRLINQRLGHRNFNTFLNQWRLAEAKEALADPAQREVPISTIALDAGFSSLGPFNRAFRTETGQTPSEFRTRSLGASAIA